MSSRQLLIDGSLPAGGESCSVDLTLHLNPTNTQSYITLAIERFISKTHHTTKQACSCAHFPLITIFCNSLGFELLTVENQKKVQKNDKKNVVFQKFAFSLARRF